MTKLSDPLDISSEREQVFRDESLNAIINRKQVLSNGICADCADAIPQSRLQANPYAQRCIACQAIYERRKKVIKGI